VVLVPSVPHTCLTIDALLRSIAERDAEVTLPISALRFAGDALFTDTDAFRRCLARRA
jgi:hypothetical protein